MTCEQGRFVGKPVVITADPTCCSGSRATVGNGTGGERFSSIVSERVNDHPRQSNQRRSGLDARRALTDTERAQRSSIICRNFLRSSLFFSANRIGVYLSTWDEVDTEEIISRSWCAKKQLFAPVIGAHREMSFCSLRPQSRIFQSRFGTLEPAGEDAIDARKLDVVVVPLVAFDSNNHRIGMGGGFYDRCFRFQNRFSNLHKPKLVGLAFSCQRVEEIALNRWDIPLYTVFSA